jgi:hypothetical protein
VLSHRKVPDAIQKQAVKRAKNCETASKLLPRLLGSKELIMSCLKLLIVDFVDINLFDSPHFRKIIGCHEEKTGMIVNCNVMHKVLQHAVESINFHIKNEIKGRMLCVLVDCVTRMSCTLVALSIRYYSMRERKIAVRTIGFMDIKKGDTTSDVCKELNKIFKTFGIDKTTVISITYSDETLIDSGNCSDASFEIEKSTNSNISSPLCNGLKTIFGDVNFTRCGMYTLKLAVTDVLKETRSTVDPILRNLLKVLKALSSDAVYAEYIKRFKIKIPKIVDANSHWNFTYETMLGMTEIEEDLRKLYKQLSGKDLEVVFISNETWSFIYKFTKAFRPTHVLSKKLANSSLPMCKLE